MRADVEKVATPETSEPDPITVVPLLKLTLPVGIAVPRACLTVATKVTGKFCVMLVADETSVVAVSAATGAAGLVLKSGLDAAGC